MSKHDQLLERYWGIADDHKNGYRIPILWHLAFRRNAEAMLMLSQELEEGGRFSSNFSQQGLAYRAYRGGSATAAQNLAMDGFNRNDLQRYRHWLRKAAQLGDAEAARELKRFEIRLPHPSAANIGRKRPYYRKELL